MKKLLCATLLLLFTYSLDGQDTADYSEQVKALKQSFDEKKPDAVTPYLSDQLSFHKYPATATPQILGQIFMRFPKLKSLSVSHAKMGEAKLKYDFEALGIRESSVHFDEQGKITKIALIDNILIEQEEAQKALASQKQGPTPGALAEKYPFEKLQFPSKDGLSVTANLYEVSSDKPVILLCHQAGYNKYEYADIAPKLNEMGFTVMAMDQRSGGEFGGQQNETSNLAKTKNLETDFVAAQQDIEAALKYLYDKYGRKVILWGSSYSSSLVLFVTEESDMVEATISFSPGDYFGEAKPSLATVLPKLKTPFFITSSRQESETVSGLLKATKTDQKHQQFIPQGDGYHGSRALWEGQKGGEEYWEAIVKFLQEVNPQ